MKKILTLMAVAAMAFTACSKEESTGTGDKQVRITPTPVSYTHLRAHET